MPADGSLQSLTSHPTRIWDTGVMNAPGPVAGQGTTLSANVRFIAPRSRRGLFEVRTQCQTHVALLTTSGHRTECAQQNSDDVLLVLVKPGRGLFLVRLQGHESPVFRPPGKFNMSAGHTKL